MITKYAIINIMSAIYYLVQSEILSTTHVLFMKLIVSLNVHRYNSIQYYYINYFDVVMTKVLTIER